MLVLGRRDRHRTQEAHNALGMHSQYCVMQGWMQIDWCYPCVVSSNAKQLTFLEHRQRTGRGGPRKNAGRKPSKRPVIHHVRRERFRCATPGLITVRVRDGLPSLRARQMVLALQQGFSECCSRTGFRLIHYSIQRDHLHLIVEADDHAALGRGMKALGTRIALTVHRVFGRRGKVMAGRYHVRRLASPRQVRNALRYVLQNIRKHRFQRTGRAGAAKIDEASSGRWFTGWKTGEVPERIGQGAPREVAFPSTWLLTVGWRRCGLIALSEIPGAAA
jgi:REP element-mobilizing transposase RayT